MPLLRVHFWVGLAALCCFIATGIYLFLRLDVLAAHNDSIRWMFRSNHIYILMSGLMNLALARDVSTAQGWRDRVRVIGSALVLAAPVILAAAFMREPGAADPQRVLTKLGVIALVLGTLARAVVARPRS